MEADEQERRGQREDDQVDEHRVHRQRHVGDEQEADDHDRVERSTMVEAGVRRVHGGRPHEQTEDPQVVARLDRRRLVLDDDGASKAHGDVARLKAKNRRSSA